MTGSTRRPTTSVPSQDETTKALRRLARTEIPLYTNLEAPLRRAVLLYWGSMAEARRALRLPEPPPRRQRWSRQRVIDEIRKLHRSGQHVSSSAIIAAGRNDLVNAAIRYAGSWSRARKLAGVDFKAHRDFKPPRWDATTVVSEIRVLHQQGLSLASSKVSSSLRCAGNRIFGNWRNAITASGLDYESILLLRQYGDDELLSWLRKLAHRRPDMTLFDLDKHGEHTTACRCRWGSLEAAAEAAGITGWPIRRRTPAMPRSLVIRTLRQWRRKHRPLALEAVRKAEGGHHLINSVFHHFKTWKSALRASEKS